jgi:hypothetical protein
VVSKLTVYFVQGPLQDFGEHNWDRKSPVFDDVMSLSRHVSFELSDLVEKQLSNVGSSDYLKIIIVAYQSVSCSSHK